MDDEEDDVFEPDPHCWRTTFREIKYQDRGTQTPGPALPPNNGMLPCGVAEEPRPLFYGEAGDSALCVIITVIKPERETYSEKWVTLLHSSHLWRLIVVITAAFMVCMECTQLLCYSKRRQTVTVTERT